MRKTEEDMKALLALESVARHGGFAAAAREMGTTRATISRIIAEAEARLNVRLCRRTTRQVVLTEAARALVQAITPSLLQIKSAVALLSEREDRLQGPIRLSVSHAFGRHWVLPVVARFQAEHPAVSVHLMLSDYLDDLVAKSVDIAVRLGAIPDSEMVARPLGQLPVTLVGTPALCPRRIPADRLEALDTLPAIAFHPVSVAEARAWVFERAGVQHVHRVKRAVIEIDSIEGAADLVRAGVGIGMLPRYLIADDLSAGRLKTVVTGWEMVGPLVHVCYTNRTLIPNRVRVLIERLVSDIGGRL